MWGSGRTHHERRCPPGFRVGADGSLDWLGGRVRGPGSAYLARGCATAPSGSTDAAPPAPVPGDGSSAVRLLRGGAVGLAAAGLVVLGRHAGALDGVVGLVGGAILALAIPTSRELSRRILLTGCLVLGWVPVLWWWDLPVGSIGRVTLLLALGAGGLIGWVVAGPRPVSRLRGLLPRVGWADVLPAGALLVGAAMLSPWLRLRSGESALSVLMTGWDHSAHYDMTAMIREHGAVVWSIAGPPGGGAWSYATYPQGYHALTAAVMELGGSPTVGTPVEEVLAYGRSLGLVALLAVVVVVAGIAAVPTLRRRPLVGAIAAGVVTAALLWGPAGLVLADGFPNFFLACALLAAVPLVAVPIARWPAPVPLVALAGALVGIAHSWALLLTMALPMALVILLPWRRRRAAVSRGRWAISGGVALVALAAALAALRVIRVQPLADIVVLGSADSALGVGAPVGVLGVCVAGVLLLAWRAARPWPSATTRTVWVVVGPVAGAAFAAWMAAVQLRQGGLGYYFWKYAIALEVLALVVGSLAVTTLIARTPYLRRPVPVVGLAAGVLVVVAVAFGAPHPAVPGALGLRDSNGLVARNRIASASGDITPEAARLLEAAATTRARGEPSVYLPIGLQTPHSPAVVSQWQAALSGRWTDALNAPMGMLVDQDMSAAGASALVRRILLAYPDVTVLVPPSVVEDVRSGIGEQLSRRVQTW